MRKSTIALITFFITAVFLLKFSEVRTNSVQPPSARTGAPSELTCGTSDCHNNTPNSGTGSVSIEFSDPEDLYLPGNTYPVTVTVTDAAQIRFGFEITSLDNANTHAGTFAEISGGSDLSFPISLNGRLYASHHNASATKVWTFNWTAPITNVGAVTFYAAGNAANGNDESTGDHIYTTTLQILADTEIGIADPTLSGTPSFIVHNLVTGQLHVQYETFSAANSTIQLFNLNGQLVQELFNGQEGKGTQAHSFELADNPFGLYFVHLRSGNILRTEKIIID
ncbi:MAG: choice-of-anchor V domain-containing protein [Chitinophagales bacterium]